MTSIPRQQGAGTRPVDIKAQLAATHNSSFPFASPTIDEDTSPRSSTSVDTIRFDNDSPNQDDTGISPILVETVSGRPGRSRKESTGHGSKWPKKLGTTLLDAKKNTRTRPRPGLQIVTNFTPLQPRAGSVVLNQVAVRKPKETRSKTRSIVSQKGVQFLSSPSPHGDSARMISSLRDLINSNREKKTNTSIAPPNQQSSTPEKQTSSPARSSVVFGLSIPEHEVSMHQHGDVLASAVTLITPVTPKIVVTPAGVEPAEMSVYEMPTNREKNLQSASLTGIHSKAVSQYHPSSYTKPASPRQQPINQVGSGNSQTNRRTSSESQQEILPDSCETARPKSQGWWNLVLSPILSRAGTLKSQMARRGDTIPPVPKVPSDVDKSMPVQTPATNISPATPRRAGLAAIRSSSWSRWTEWEDDKAPSDELEEIHEEGAPPIPMDYLSDRSVPGVHPVTVPDFQSEGAAAEYYHACAVEQLTNVTYFECINHSCSERRLKLLSSRNARNEVIELPGHSTDDATETKDIKDPRSTELNTTSIAKPDDAVPAAKETFNKSLNLPGNDNLGGNNKSASLIESTTDIAEVVSPNLRKAQTAAFSRARAVTPPKPSQTSDPADTKAATRPLSIKPITSILSPQTIVESPGPISPEATRTVAPPGAVPMVDMRNAPATNAAPLTEPMSQPYFTMMPQNQPQPVMIYYQYPQSGPYPVMVPPPHPPHMDYQFSQTTPDEGDRTVPPTGQQSALPSVVTDHHEGIILETNKCESTSSEKKDEEEEKKEMRKRKGKNIGLLCCLDRSKSENTPKNRRLKIAVVTFLLIIIILCILFALLLTRGNGNVDPIASQWLNLSGYPPVPTGISTIAQPNLAAAQGQCLSPATIWSCSLPKEEQASISPNEPDQPNFRFQIRFHNGTVPANLTIPLGKGAVGSSESSDDDGLFVPNPAAPGLPDQQFLGNTTDHNAKPFEGEVTPFFITFINADSGSSSPANGTKKLVARQGDNTALNSIPPPSTGSDGTAAPASLLPTNPFPISQPIKLYNRGLPDEHYGFYMYYDKSIFLSGLIIQNDTAVNNTQASPDADTDGGSTKQAATVQCTWAQTRFVVKMYTNPAFNGRPFPRVLAGNSSTSATTQKNSSLAQSANDFNRPGSFPYPTTILLDRHGGDFNKKMVYCYGMDNGSIVADEQTLLLESRGFNGTLVNPAPDAGFGASNSSSPLTSEFGGIDGGSGGCGCTWQNWA